MTDLGRQIGERAQAREATEPLELPTVAIPARVMARLDFWTGEGKYTPTESGEHEWIGRRAGDGAPVLRLIVAQDAPPRELGLRLGRSHRDTVYRQFGDQPSDGDPRVAVFMGPDAEALAAAYVALANGEPR